VSRRTSASGFGEEIGYGTTKSLGSAAAFIFQMKT